MKRRVALTLGVLAVAGAVVGGALAIAGGDGGPGVDASAPDETEFPPDLSPYRPHIDPADFVATIDNPYLPFEPGTTLFYEGTSEGEKETDEVFVTHETKEILGVTCVVVRDIVRADGEITEKTFDWYAQDRFGNVWYFGEDSHEYENGKPINAAGSWEAGVDGALPGIVMLGDPQVGDRYRQEYYAGKAEDLGGILKLDASVTVPYGSFDSVLVTKDSTPLEPNVLEHKYYAPGVGLVMEQSMRGPKEAFELVAV
ncbi:MAG: hypothetical protein ACRDI3_04090, partial [Actinomycetota bacterium]